MKIKTTFDTDADGSINPYYMITLRLTYMTEREFCNAVRVIEKIRPEFDVVLRQHKGEP